MRRSSRRQKKREVVVQAENVVGVVMDFKRRCRIGDGLLRPHLYDKDTTTALRRQPTAGGPAD